MSFLILIISTLVFIGLIMYICYVRSITWSTVLMLLGTIVVYAVIIYWVH
ncbi:hypothetical protein [Acetilactobacillus jinshanensis]|nr:hypothetical protein [Acetilactobacillus jinshanensis]URL61210.1 hypothetical protein HGK75_04230 [uncultured bacterium]